MTKNDPSEHSSYPTFQQVAAVLCILAITIAFVTQPDFEKLATLIAAIAALAAFITIPHKLQRSLSIALSVGVLLAAVFVTARTFSTSSREERGAVPTTVPSASFPQIATPESGSIKHSSPNGIALACADVQVKNFIVESRFFNPFDKKLNPWSYGFYFRYRPGNEYRLTVNQAGRVGFGIAEEKIVRVLSERFPEG